jgi:hypothetical protein
MCVVLSLKVTGAQAKSQLRFIENIKEYAQNTPIEPFVHLLLLCRFKCSVIEVLRKSYTQPNRKINIDAALVCIGATVTSPIGRLK